MQSRNSKIGIVFITAYEKRYSELIFDGVNPSGFIRKPISVEAVCKYVNKIYNQFLNAEKKITIQTTLGNLTVPLSKLYYIESQGRNLEYHIGNDILTAKGTMSAVLKTLPSNSFAQCHRSYIVNLNTVIKMETDQFILTSGVPISITSKYRESVREKYFALKGMSYTAK